MLMAFVLGSSSVSGIKVWKVLRKRFFAYYRIKILSWYGYENYRPVKKPIVVGDSGLIIEFFSVMKQRGKLGDCSYEELAEALLHVFDLKYAPATVILRMKGEGVEYYTQVADFFDKIK